jgi:hypothetical protein
LFRHSKISLTIKQIQMKKLLIATIALAGLSISSFAQTAAPVAKKADAGKMQTVKKTDAKVVAIHKTPTTAAIKAMPAPAAKPASKTAATAAMATTTRTTAGPVKKDGTPDKRFKANQAIAKAPLKKNGTPDMRFKENKKHS